MIWWGDISLSCNTYLEILLSFIFLGNLLLEGLPLDLCVIPASPSSLTRLTILLNLSVAQQKKSCCFNLADRPVKYFMNDV